MIIVSQSGRIFNFNTAHSVNFTAEVPDGFVARIYYWHPLENPNLPGSHYLVSYKLGTFQTKEAIDEVYMELIEAFENGDRLYRIPEEMTA